MKNVNNKKHKQTLENYSRENVGDTSFKHIEEDVYQEESHQRIYRFPRTVAGQGMGPTKSQNGDSALLRPNP